MDSPSYVALSRQTGLARELDVIANNIANASTTGFRRQGLVFAEHMRAAGAAPGLSMARAHGRSIDAAQGALRQTNGHFDFAIEGAGFFLVETPQGERLTRAGHFLPDAEGTLVTPQGYRLLDAGGAPVAVPPLAAAVSLSTDGTLSADGVPLAQIGLFLPADPARLRHQAGTLLDSPAGTVPAEEARLHQGFLEDSNVNPMTEMTRLIAVQRSYELAQRFLDREDERLRGALQTLGRS